MRKYQDGIESFMQTENQICCKYNLFVDILHLILHILIINITEQ